MRVLLSLIFLAAAAGAQQNRAPVQGNLPNQPIGPNDLISVSVVGAPDLSLPVRVSADGYIRMPMMKDRIKAQGLFPEDLEKAIAAQLVEEQLLVDPYVTVSIAEYHSRPIVVGGAVKTPTTFQAEGPTTLLEALSRAQGLTENARQEILVTTLLTGPGGKPAPLVRRISVQGLFNEADPALNSTLTGGEEIRVPEAKKIYVLGNVKMPISCRTTRNRPSYRYWPLPRGSRPITARQPISTARTQPAPEPKSRCRSRKIVARKSPDVVLMPDDLFYVPDRKGRRMTLTALEKLANMGGSAGAALIYTLRY